jgi:hypothetical protein
LWGQIAICVLVVLRRTDIERKFRADLSTIIAFCKIAQVGSACWMVLFFAAHKAIVMAAL